MPTSTLPKNEQGQEPISVVFTRKGGDRLYSRRQKDYTVSTGKHYHIGDDYEAGEVPADLAVDLVDGGVGRYVYPRVPAAEKATSEKPDADKPADGPASVQAGKAAKDAPAS